MERTNNSGGSLKVAASSTASGENLRNNIEPLGQRDIKAAIAALVAQGEAKGLHLASGDAQAWAGGGREHRTAGRSAVDDSRPAPLPFELSSEVLTAKPVASAPDSGNTGAPSSHKDLLSDPPELIAGDLDYLEVSLYGEWSRESWEQLREALKRAKAAAENGDDENACIQSPDGDVALVSQKQAWHGVVCPWVLSWCGITIAIRDTRLPDENHISVHVSIPSVPLMEIGSRECWSRVVAFLAAFGFSIVKETPGRIDACVDLAGYSVADFATPFYRDQVIMRAEKDGCVRADREVQTAWVGKGDVRLRVYDKLAELRDNHDEIKLELLIAKRYGSMPDKAVRVEFQLRRKPLHRQFGIDSVADLFAKLPYIVQYLTTKWFRLTEETVTQEDRNNKNQKRFQNHSFWNLVISAFESWVSAPVESYRITRFISRNFDQARKQMAGCFARLIALTGDVVDTSDDLWQAIAKQIRICESDFLERIGIKRRELAAGMPTTVLWHPMADEIPF